jgi:hypothetical protein
MVLILLDLYLTRTRIEGGIGLATQMVTLVLRVLLRWLRRNVSLSHCRYYLFFIRNRRFVLLYWCVSILMSIRFSGHWITSLLKEGVAPYCSVFVLNAFKLRRNNVNNNDKWIKWKATQTWLYHSRPPLPDSDALVYCCGDDERILNPMGPSSSKKIIGNQMKPCLNQKKIKRVRIRTNTTHLLVIWQADGPTSHCSSSSSCCWQKQQQQ